jgi:hypothetical protein
MTDTDEQTIVILVTFTAAEISRLMKRARGIPLAQWVHDGALRARRTRRKAA